MRGSMKKIYLFGGLSTVTVALVGYHFLGGNGGTKLAPTGQLKRVVTVVRGNLDLTVSANGVVQPINKVEIRSKASGQILELNFEEGSYVKKGDLLAALDQTTTKNDFEQAKADLATAQQQLSQAENATRRAQQLYEKKLISDQDLDQSKLDLVKAQSQLVRATAALSSAEEKLRDTRILAPISGIILSRSVDRGQIIASALSNVGGGTALATVANMDEVHIEANVDEVDIGKVAVGQRAKVVADAFPDDTFHGKVIRIAPLGKTQQNVTTFSVVILVKNVAGKLKAGMSASVGIEIFRRQNVLLVPNEALKDPRSDQGRALLASIKTVRDTAREHGKGRKELMAQGDGQTTAREGRQLNLEEMRERMQNASPQERQKMHEQLRERFEKMSPEERQKEFAQFQQRMIAEGQTGPPPGGLDIMPFDGGSGGTGGEKGFQQRRQSQVDDANEVKERIVMVKQGEQFVPWLIKIGASNFDYAEVLEGLKEGDEIQIITSSRAKIEADQMSERVKSMQGMGGMPSGGPPPSGAPPPGL
jgi:HlyD family secretion protein